MKISNDNSLVQPYLFFEGRCEEAIEFYKKAVGAEVQMMLRFKDSPEAPPPGAVPAGSENKIMHAQIRIGQTVVMMGDSRCSGKPVFEGFFLSITVPTPAEVDPLYNGLLEGGQTRMPLAKTFFSPRFGMVMDRFGVGWMILAQGQQPKS